MDADEEESNSNKGNAGGSGGGHGNTKIPFGLCLREGISIEPDWGPKEAWDALAGKGYTASAAYKELKETGKVSKPAPKAPEKPKKAPTVLEESHFPAGLLSKTYKRNTPEFAKYINEVCKDPDVSELLSLATAPGSKQFPKMDVKRSMDGEGCYVRPTWFSVDKTPYSYEIVIPHISKAKTPEQKAQAVRSFAHEYTHFLDDMARGDTKKSQKYSGQDKELDDAIKANDWKSYGEEIVSTFDDFNRGYDGLVSQYKKDRGNAAINVMKAMYPEKPAWLRDDGSVSYSYPARMDWEEVKRYEKAVKAAKKELTEKFNREKRAYMDGVVNLQGIYDSLSGGKLRASGGVKFGHSTSYFDREPANKAIEVLADYVALRATRPDLADMFRRDKPDIAKALDNTIAGMVKRLRGAE